MKADKSYSNGRLFFRRIGDKGFNYINSQEIPVGLNNGYHTYIINLKNNQNWSGVVNQLILQPISSKGKIELKSVKLTEHSLIIKMASIWQEILKFEKPLPRTINFIYGPKIGGKLINGYIYFLIIITSTAFIIFYAIKFKDLPEVINNSIPKILIVCFAFWILLDIRTALEQIRMSILNYQTFGGKSLEEKQALSTYGNYYDFYYFLKEVSKIIPAESNYSLIVPKHYVYYSEKARYYLYPIYENKINPEFIIVYDPQIILKEADIPNNKYKHYSNINNNGYILKRNN